MSIEIESGYYDLRVIVKTKTGETEARMKLDCYVTDYEILKSQQRQFKADLEQAGNTLVSGITFKRSLNVSAYKHVWSDI
jgi:hypothetical protein